MSVATDSRISRMVIVIYIFIVELSVIMNPDTQINYDTQVNFLTRQAPACSITSRDKTHLQHHFRMGHGGAAPLAAVTVALTRHVETFAPETGSNSQIVNLRARTLENRPLLPVFRRNPWMYDESAAYAWRRVSTKYDMSLSWRKFICVSSACKFTLM